MKIQQSAWNADNPRVKIIRKISRACETISLNETNLNSLKSFFNYKKPFLYKSLLSKTMGNFNCTCVLNFNSSNEPPCQFSSCFERTACKIVADMSARPTLFDSRLFSSRFDVLVQKSAGRDSEFPSEARRSLLRVHARKVHDDDADTAPVVAGSVPKRDLAGLSLFILFILFLSSSVFNLHPLPNLLSVRSPLFLSFYLSLFSFFLSFSIPPP